MEIKMIVPAACTFVLWMIEAPLWTQVLPFAMWFGYHFGNGFRQGWEKRSSNIKDYLPPRI